MEFQMLTPKPSSQYITAVQMHLKFVYLFAARPTTFQQLATRYDAHMSNARVSIVDQNNRVSIVAPMFRTIKEPVMKLAAISE